MKDLVKQFPIMHGEGKLRSIPWAMIAPHEKQALRNHDQTIQRLAERSGLSPCEALCVMAGQSWPQSWFGGVPKDLHGWTAAVLATWAAQFNETRDIIERLERE